MTRVPDLDSVESRCHQRLETLTTSIASWMRPDCDCSGFVRNRDRVLDRQSILRYEGTSVVAEVARERIAKIGNDSTRDHGSRDVGAAARPAVGLLQDLVQRERHAKSIELFHDPARAGVAKGAQVLEV